MVCSIEKLFWRLASRVPKVIKCICYAVYSRLPGGGKKDCKKYILFLLENLNVYSDSLDVIKFSIYFKYKKTIERKAESWG